jgi:hypothetical protein
MNRKIAKLIVICLFCIAFATIGTFAPVLYASYAPSDTYIEAHSYETSDATLSQEEHRSCFKRTIYADSSGVSFTELFLVTEDGERIELSGQRMKQHFPEGTLTERIVTDLPDDISTGKYHYERAYRMNLAAGRVERTFTFQSEPFNITNNSTAPPPSC